MSNNLEIVITSDGSATLYNASVGENYHSKHGALQESQHVFVNSGLQFFIDQFQQTEVDILEVGFGTGLNFLLSAELLKKANIRINYTGIEKYPVPQHLLAKTEYGTYIKSPENWQKFLEIYDKSFADDIEYIEGINLRNHQVDLLAFNDQKKYDIIYFDAFAAVHQPEMWTKESIAHTCSFLKDKGIFVTYSVTGELKRNLKSLGFNIQRPAGAAGKREMMRAIKS
jgi:tRNA U34 5-methylaminomethyl-2-thiouridine-forming methyltransferase MnmC